MGDPSPTRPDVIVVGDVMIDVAVAAGALARGGDVHGEVRLRPGGSGPNAAAWAAATGAAVRLHGRVGADLGGRLLVEALAERGVDVAVAVDPEARTGTMLVVTEAGERSMVADRGANARLTPDDLPPRLDAGAVLVSGYLLFHPGSEAAARAALDRAATRHAAVDAASWPLVRGFGAERFFEATRAATVLLANEAEARALAGREPDAGGGPDDAAAEEVAAALAERYPRVVIKRGARGSVAAESGAVTRAATPAVEEADATGAGDAFDGVLLAALARGAPMEEALRRAAEAGARAAASPDTWPP